MLILHGTKSGLLILFYFIFCHCCLCFVISALNLITSCHLCLLGMVSSFFFFFLEILGELFLHFLGVFCLFVVLCRYSVLLGTYDSQICFTVLHKFGYIVYLFLFNSIKSLIFSLIFVFTHFHLVVCCSVSMSL
jgi:hypothetical protein